MVVLDASRRNRSVPRLAASSLGTMRPGHDQRAVRAGATLPKMRAKEPRASVRACSYHASPGACQSNVLCIGLWMIYVNTLVNLSTAVDERCCGKVDNRCDTGSCQVADRPRSTGRCAYPQASPRGPLVPCYGRVRSSHGGIRGHEGVPMSLDSATTGDSKPLDGDWGWSRRCAWPDWYLGYYRSGRQLPETIA